VGDLVGSNIADILVIFGLSALITPIKVGPSALRRDGVIVLLSAILFAAVSWVWVLDRLVGVVFLAGLVACIVFAHRQEIVVPATAAFEKAEAHDEVVDHHRKTPPGRREWASRSRRELPLAAWCSS
jgi:cation:H+ antiporter